jgi:hypothetical protein
MDYKVNDFGIPITIALKRQRDGQPLDIATASSLLFVFTKPSGGGTIQRNGVFVTDGTDGEVTYVWQPGELNLKGTWKYEVYVTMPGALMHSDTGTFNVAKNLV